MGKSVKRIHFAYATISALLATIFIFIPLIRNGLEISSDSVVYIDGARNMLAGYGFSIGCPPNTNPVLHWAPLYSLAILIPQAAGFSWMVSIQIIAGLIYTIIAILTFTSVFEYTHSYAISALSQIGLFVHPIILNNAVFAGSDSLQWVILILFARQLVVTLQSPSFFNAIVLGFLGSLGMLTRYAFAGFLIGSFSTLLIASAFHGIRRTITAIFIEGITVCGIFAIWLARNFLLSRQFLAGGGGRSSLIQNAVYSGMNLSDIFFSKLFSGTTQVVLTIAIVCVIGVSGMIGIYQIFWKKNNQPVMLWIICNLCLILGYLATLVTLRTIADPITLDQRMFSPLVLPATFILAGIFAIRPISRSSRNPSAFLLALPLIGFVTLASISTCLSYNTMVSRDLGYRSYEDSPTMQATADLYQQGIVTSPDNGPFLLWMKYCVIAFPRDFAKPVLASEIKQVAPAIVLFDHSQKRFVLTEGDIVWDIPYSEHHFEDGRIFVFE